MRDETEKGKKGRRGRKWGEKEKERERRESWQKGGKNGGKDRKVGEIWPTKRIMTWLFTGKIGQPCPGLEVYQISFHK